MESSTTKAPPFHIILRYSLDPHNGIEENLRQLERFLEESTVNEVMFLLLPEERSSGHPTIEAAKPWVQAIQQIQVMLNKHGVKTSLNPWTTTYHCARGRSLKPEQDFCLMFGETGVANGITACPRCEKWQQYISDYFCYLTEEIRPTAMWVEDDWRLHNHGSEMGYGGCFCSHCLDVFAAQLGHPVTREEVVSKVVQEGQPHSWRKRWLELSRETLERPAKRLATAMHAIDSTIRIGLMSSIPDVHSIEGRDWNGLMDIWTRADEAYLIRPHMPPYTEEPPLTTTPCYSRQTIALLERDADIYPELENSPRSGQYSGSHAFSIWQIYNSIFYGSQGITINHFDNMGMNTQYDPGFGKALAQHRLHFDALSQLKLDDKHARGVKVLFSPNVAEKKWIEKNAPVKAAKMYTGVAEVSSGSSVGTLQQLQTNSTAWSKLLYVMGVSHSLTSKIEGSEGSIFAVSDETLRCFTDTEIIELLGYRVLLDLPSVEILLERGFGALIGVNSAARVSLADVPYSIEEIETSFYGALGGDIKARMCAQRCADPIGVIEYHPDVNKLSTIKDAELNSLFPASGLYKNEIGGQIYSCCYQLETSQFYMAYFNRIRQKYWTKLLFEMSGAGSSQVIAQGHVMHVHSHDINGGFFCALTNVIYDKAEAYSLLIASSAIEGKTIYRLNAEAQWEKFSPRIFPENGVSTLNINIQLFPLESLLLKFIDKVSNAR